MKLRRLQSVPVLMKNPAHPLPARIVLIGLPLVLISQISLANEAALPPRRAHHALVYDEARGAVVLTSGSTSPNGQSFTFYNDLWAYDGTTWEYIGTAGDERSGIGLAYDSRRDRIVSFGGFSNGNSLGDLRVLEGNQWTVLANISKLAAAEPGFVYDIRRDRCIAFGGSGKSNQLHATTYEWNGATWIISKATGPAGRQAFVMEYDENRGRTVLFGGLGNPPGQLLGDTWEYDGVNWIKMDSTGPAPRASAGAAYDPVNGMVVIFGGIGADTTFGDTWGWNGKTWHRLAESGPAPRSMGYMAFDQKNKRIVMFGGRLGWPNDANDTWEWDGQEWYRQ